MILNLHERWLLRSVGVRQREQRALLRALAETGQTRGDVDLLAETGGFALAKRSVPKDLASLFDQLMSPYDTPAHGVAYGNRRYRKPVLLAAALHQAGVSAATYRSGAAAGYRRLSKYKELAKAGT
jgi:hypothetical protein